MGFLVTIYSHVVKKRRDEKLQGTKEERRQVLQGSYGGISSSSLNSETE